MKVHDLFGKVGKDRKLKGPTCLPILSTKMFSYV